MSAAQEMIRAQVENEINRLPSAEDSFRRGWQEALRGDTHPLEELWVGIDTPSETQGFQ